MYAHFPQVSQATHVYERHNYTHNHDNQEHNTWSWTVKCSSAHCAASLKNIDLYLSKTATVVESVKWHCYGLDIVTDLTSDESWFGPCQD